MQKHTSTTYKWLKQIEKINKRRDYGTSLNETYHKKKL